MDERSASALLSTWIQEVKLSLKHVHSAAVPAYEAIEHFLSALFDNSDTCEVRIRRGSKAMEKYYVCLAELLVESYSLDWQQSCGTGRCLDDLLVECFTRGPALLAVSVLNSGIRRCDSKLECHRLIVLLESLMRDRNAFLEILRSECIDLERGEAGASRADSSNARTPIDRYQDIVRTITSLPDTVMPSVVNFGLPSKFFCPDVYVPFLCSQMSVVLHEVYANLRDGKTSSVAVISAIFGKLASSGYGTIVWNYFLIEFESIIVKDFLWQRIWQRLINTIPDRQIEQSVVPLVIQAESADILKGFLGNLPSSNSKMKHLFGCKLLLFHYYEDSHVVRNIVRYLSLCEDLAPLFVTVFESLLQAWADGSSLRYRPQEQSLYICKAVVVCIACLKNDPKAVVLVKDSVRQSLLNGSRHYLDSTEPRIRQMGCFVTELLAEIASDNETAGQKLNFGLKQDDLIISLQSLLVEENRPPWNNTVDNGAEVKSAAKQHTDDVSFGNVVRESDDTKSRLRNTDSADSEVLDSDDEPDELKSLHDMSTDYASNKTKKPTYLLQCIEGLLKDDVDLFEASLGCAELLVRSHNEVKELAVEMTKVLLHLEDRFNTPNFSQLRLRTMVALVVASPSATASYLTGEFYARNYNVRQRIDILDTLTTAARELSDPSSATSKSAKDLNHIVPLSTNDNLSEHSQSWKDIVQARIDKKTKRTHSKAPARPCPVENRFTAVAGYFFYPLMRDYDAVHHGNHLDLVGNDHILLERLLHALGVMMYAASNISGVDKMAKALLEFTWCFRHHTRSGIRQALLYAVCMMIIAVPGFVLMDQLQEETVDIKCWLEQVSVSDAEAECRVLASQSLVLLRASLEPQLSVG